MIQARFALESTLVKCVAVAFQYEVTPTTKSAPPRSWYTGPPESPGLPGGTELDAVSPANSPPSSFLPRAAMGTYSTTRLEFRCPLIRPEPTSHSDFCCAFVNVPGIPGIAGVTGSWSGFG